MQQGRPRPSPPPWARGRLYDVAAAVTRVGVGWLFTEFGLSLRGREHLVAERLSDSGLTPLAFFAPLVPALLVAFSVAFAVGLLTWLTGPALALAAVVGTLGAGTEHLSPFDSWGATALVTAVCVLMAMSGGRWSWDHLVLGAGTSAPRPGAGGTTSTARGKAPAISHRRPEHAPPLLYPVEQAALRRPYRM
ncbi:DoxX family protein [Nocardiopsis sp. NPDC055551]